MKKKIGYQALAAFVLAIAVLELVFLAPSSVLAQDYAVGGEIVPLAIPSFLGSSAIIVVIAAIIVLAVAVVSRAAGIEISIEPSI